MIFWSWFFSANSRFAPNTAQSAQWNRGAYLAEALAHCGDCHTPRNLAFALDNRKKFAGAVTAGWHAFNITSDKGTGIGGWSDDEVAAYLAKGHAPDRGTAAGPMGEAVDHSFSHMAATDISALVVYLRSVPPIASSDLPATIAPPAPASPSASKATADALGKKVFQEACVSCHDWTGVSAISSYATIAGARAVNDPAATNVAQIVVSGTRRLDPKRNHFDAGLRHQLIPTPKLPRSPIMSRRGLAASHRRSPPKTWRNCAARPRTDGETQSSREPCGRPRKCRPIAS